MSERAPHQAVIRNATPSDLDALLLFIEPFVEQQHVLARTREEMARLILHGFVADELGEIVGFAAIEIYSKKLAEVQCLCVLERVRNQGLGRQLVAHCVERAKQEHVRELMAITANDRLFHDCGFDYSLPNQKKALFIQMRD